MWNQVLPANPSRMPGKKLASKTRSLWGAVFSGSATPLLVLLLLAETPLARQVQEPEPAPVPCWHGPITSEGKRRQESSSISSGITSLISEMFTNRRHDAVNLSSDSSLGQQNAICSTACRQHWLYRNSSMFSRATSSSTRGRFTFSEVARWNFWRVIRVNTFCYVSTSSKASL